jgi:hypothetical protein
MGWAGGAAEDGGTVSRPAQRLLLPQAYPSRSSAASSLPCRPPKPPLLMMST